MKTNIVQKKCSELELWEDNPRAIDKKRFEELKKSIKELGFNDVLKVAADGKTVIGGNMRLRALLELGVEDVNVIVTNAETPQDMFRVALRDNEEFGYYEQEAVAELALSLGFEQTELESYQLHLGKPSLLSELVNKYQPEPEDDEDDGEGVTDEPISKKGEVYELGRHRLMCGDSTSLDDVGLLMGEDRADLVFTDPPYMVDYHSDDTGSIKNDNLDDEDAGEFYVDVLKCLYTYSKDTAALYWWLAMKNWHINQKAMVDTGWYPSQTIIWVKESMVFAQGQDFHRMYEPCIFGWKKGKVHYKNKRVCNYKDAFTLDKAGLQDILDVWFESRDKTTEYVHPTQKPIGLCLRALRKHTAQNAVVLDLFGGSGSTLIACDGFGRTARLMELDPKFCDAIRKRYAKLIGEEDSWQEATPVQKQKQ